MKPKQILTLILTFITLSASVCSCAPAPSTSSVTASGAASKYADFLEERLEKMPEKLVLDISESSVFGIDMSEFADTEGFCIRANNGEVVIIARSEAGLDRAVRQYVKYGNPDSYSFTYGEGYRIERLTVAGNDISQYAVVRPDDADDAVCYASSELVRYINASCGHLLHEYTESEYAAKVGAEMRVIRLTVDYPALGDEGFGIHVLDDGDIVISGGRYRGCMYGVYGLLRDIGWRFIDSDNEYLYASKHLDLTSEIDRTEIPSVKVRQTSLEIDYYERAFITGRHGYFGIVEKACHGLDVAGIDWSSVGFKREDGQPCYTDESVLALIEEHYRRYIERRLAEGAVVGKDLCYIDVAQFDSQSFCVCDSCAEVLYEEGSASGAVLRMTNRMADMAAEYDPEIYAAMLAYAGTNTPPRVTVPRDNVKISYCFYPSGNRFPCSNHTVTDPECSRNAVFLKELNGWMELLGGKNLQVWYYPLNCYEIAFQLPAFDTAYDDITYFKEAGAENIFLCGEYNNGDSILQSSIARLMWDGDMTREEYDDVVGEYFDLVYGDSGKYIYEYTMMLQEAGNRAGCWLSYHTAASDKVDHRYVADHFDQWCFLLDEAVRVASTEKEERMARIIRARMYYVCIGITYTDRYVNGDSEDRALIAERYEEMHRVFRENELLVFDDYMTKLYAPEVLDIQTNPFDSWCPIW